MSNKIKETFDDIHESWKWLKKDPEKETSCWKWSKLSNNIELIESLAKIIEKYWIKNIIDVWCWDVNWMRYFFNFLVKNKINYYWLDASEHILKTAKEKTKEILDKKEIPNNISFSNTLITEFDYTPSNKETTLVISKDVLVHLPNSIVKETLESIKNKALYALLTNFPDRKYNKLNQDIELWDWRPIDLTKKPFNLNNPIEIIKNTDKSTKEIFPTKNMSLFKF